MAAFESLYAVSYGSFRAEAAKYFSAVEDIDDVLQESYISIYKNLQSLKAPEAFFGWGRQIVHNHCVNYIKRRDARQGKLDYLPLSGENEQQRLDDIPVAEYRKEFNPEAYMEAQEMREVLDEILGSLSEEQRTVLMLWSEDLTYREIGEKLGISEGTAKSRAFYAKKKVSEYIRAMEKEKNWKLFSMAPIPFFLWLLRPESGLLMAPLYGAGNFAAVQTAVAGETVLAGSAAAGAAGAAAKIPKSAGASAGQTAAQSAAGLGKVGMLAAGVTGKAAAIAAAVVIGTGAIAGTAIKLHNSANPILPQSVDVYAESQIAGMQTPTDPSEDPVIVTVSSVETEEAAEDETAAEETADSTEEITETSADDAEETAADSADTEEDEMIAEAEKEADDSAENASDKSGAGNSGRKSPGKKSSGRKSSSGGKKSGEQGSSTDPAEPAVDPSTDPGTDPGVDPGTETPVDPGDNPSDPADPAEGGSEDPADPGNDPAEGGTEDPAGPEDPADPGEDPEDPKPHVHTFVDVYETVHHDAVTEEQWVPNIVTVVDQEAWDEDVYSEKKTVWQCADCGAQYSGYLEALIHAVRESHNTSVTQVTVGGEKTGTIHHDAVTHEEDQGHHETVVVTEAWDEQVKTGRQCSECGEME